MEEEAALSEELFLERALDLS